MSTILEALRKAKTEPLPNGVEARPGILNPLAHDYLAAAPQTGRDEVRVLRRIVYGSIAIIVLLALVVVSLLLRQNNPTAAASPEAASVQGAPQAIVAKPAETVPPPAAQEIPEQQVQIAVVTPMATPTEPPMLQPEPVLIPVSVGDGSEFVQEETDDSVQARAAELRSQLAAKPDPKRKRAVVSSDSSAGGIQDIRIGGILWDKDSPMAMVEDKVVKPGSVVRGARIIAINKDSIVFEQNGKQFTVRQ